MSYPHVGSTLAQRNTTACEAGLPAAFNQQSGRGADDPAVLTARGKETMTAKGGGMGCWQQWVG